MRTFGLIVGWLCFPWLMLVLTLCGAFDDE